MIEAKIICDACGEILKADFGNSGWEIAMKFRSGWNPQGDVRMIQLCGECGYKAAHLLGFQYDTGKILSLAQGDMIDGVEVHGPHGGGLSDIALHGVGGAHNLQWHSQRPDIPSARRAYWMRHTEIDNFRD